jgi:hypothetical protein
MKYHYVVFGCKEEYFRLMFKDSIEQQDVEYISNPIKDGGYNKLLCLLYAIHHYDYLNWPKELPLKDRWYPLYYKRTCNKPICFIFMMDWCKDKYVPLFNILRNKYPDCKILLYLEDILHSRSDFNFELLKVFDKVITYDKGDADRCKILYYPTFMSKLNLEVIESEKTNACFWGVEKNRRDIINKVFDLLKANGMKCNFLVTRSKDKSLLSEGIKTSKHEKSYMEYLQAVVNTDCIVEIMHTTAVGYTLRTWEALIYGKKLLTNNMAIKGEPFYNPNQIVCFETPEDINVMKLKKPLESNKFDVDSISPVRFFEFLENTL